MGNLFTLKQFLILCVLFSGLCFANQPQSEITTYKFHFGLAMGVGTITNPLNGGDNFPLLVIPDIALYGEYFYFDNGQLGLSLHNTELHSINLVSELNPENRFFVTWHPAKVFSSASGFADFDNQAVDISEVKKTDWALDGGINYQYFGDDWRLSASIFTDVSSIHHGERAEMSVVKALRYKVGLLSVGLGLDYLSQQSADYYYGLQEEDNAGVVFRQSAAIIPSVELNWNMPLNKTFGFLAKFKYEYLGDLSDSPLFSANRSLSVFAGVTYVF